MHVWPGRRIKRDICQLFDCVDQTELDKYSDPDEFADSDRYKGQKLVVNKSPNVNAGLNQFPEGILRAVCD